VEKGKVFTSEAVSEGHPDKICDQISDAILTECLKVDKDAHVACEVMIGERKVVIGGEITMNGHVDYVSIAKSVLKEIGYNSYEDGFDTDNAEYEILIKEQSSDIFNAVNKDELGAGDQGIIFGYACDETKNYMPLTLEIANKILLKATENRKKGEFSWARPDMKSQVSIEYGDKNKIDTILVSIQHTEEYDEEKFKKYIKDEIVEKVLTEYDLIKNDYKLIINPSGRFVIGGPRGDFGLTGRKIIVDTYGGRGRHGGGAFSGKDPTKVDRSAAYYARYVAKNIVASGVAKECEIQVSYAIGMCEPVSLNVFTYGSSKVNDNELCEMVKKIFDFRPSNIIKELDLLNLNYRELAKNGHFGKENMNLSYEKIDRLNEIKEYFEREGE
jgi:S-adenosylmethionine synthetase